VGHAILAALVEDPTLLSAVRESDAKRVKRVKSEAADPELALLRWEAARGLALTSLLGLCPLSDKERGRLFDRLLDERQWVGCSGAPKKPRSVRASRGASSGDQSA
jgi:hypothetical protein